MRHKGGILSQISVVNAANNSTQLELGHHSDVEGSSRAKNLKRIDTCECITESICCEPEVNTTL